MSQVEEVIGLAEPPSVAGRLALRVVAIRDLSPRIREFTLASATGEPLPTAEAGSHISVDLGGGLVRSYSLTGPRDGGGEYRIAVLREEGSRGGSAHMHNGVAVGGILAAEAPLNHFPLAAGSGPHLLIAGGVGITPVVSMAQELLGRGADFELHYCVPARTDAAYLDLLEPLLGDRLVVHETRDGGVRPNMKALLAQRLPGQHAYVCGPAGMIDGVKEAAAHWPVGTVHSEAFAGSAAAASAAPDEPFEVELLRSGRRMRVPSEQSLLAVLQADGVPVKAVCREGWCGTCRVRVLAGVVDHRDEVLEDEERAEFMQACVSRAAPGSTLLLDL